MSQQKCSVLCSLLTGVVSCIITIYYYNILLLQSICFKVQFVCSDLLLTLTVTSGCLSHCWALSCWLEAVWSFSGCLDHIYMHWAVSVWLFRLTAFPNNCVTVTFDCRMESVDVTYISFDHLRVLSYTVFVVVVAVVVVFMYS